MKPFMAFVKKEWFHILRDRRTLLILFGMPIAQIILFGFAITNEIKDAHIAVVDPSHDHLTQELINRLTSSGYFLLDETLSSTAEIESVFKKGDVRLVVVFSPDFANTFVHDGKASIQLVADASDPNTATTLVNYASAIVQTYHAEMTTGPAVQSGLVPEVRMVYNPEMKGVYMFVPGVITLILMLVSAMLTSITIAREKEAGTMELLLVSPLRPPLIILGKVMPYVVLSLVNTLSILLLSRLVFGMPMNGSLVLLLSECLLFILTSLALGVFISTRVDTQLAAMLISMAGLMLPTILLSGFIFPIESMPLPLQLLANVMPAKWFIIIVKDVMVKGVPLMYICVPTVILAVMTAVFLAASVRSFKIRLN